MNIENIALQIKDIVVKVLDSSEFSITVDSEIKDITEWDSMRHVEIISAVEKHFNIEFDLLEIVDFESIKDIAEAVKKIINEA